jgi:hypothetical protein
VTTDLDLEPAIRELLRHVRVSFVGRPSIADATRIGGTRGRHLREDRAEDVTGARSAIAAIRILRRPAGGKDV